MTPAALLAQARRIWPLDWQIDPGAANPVVVTAEHGALVVVAALTTPLTVVGSLGDEDFFVAEAEADKLAVALAALEGVFRELVDVPGQQQAGSDDTEHGQVRACLHAALALAQPPPATPPWCGPAPTESTTACRGGDVAPPVARHSDVAVGAEIIDGPQHMALGDVELAGDAAGGDGDLAFGIIRLGQTNQHLGVAGQEGPGHAVCSWQDENSFYSGIILAGGVKTTPTGRCVPSPRADARPHASGELPLAGKVC